MCRAVSTGGMGRLRLTYSPGLGYISYRIVKGPFVLVENKQTICIGGGYCFLVISVDYFTKGM